MGKRKGRPTFERGSAGLSMVNYYMVKVEKGNVEKSSTTRQQVDAVELEFKRIAKLSRVEQNRLKKRLGW